jgi:hypothetical protein
MACSSELRLWNQRPISVTMLTPAGAIKLTCAGDFIFIGYIGQCPNADRVVATAPLTVVGESTWRGGGPQLMT